LNQLTQTPSVDWSTNPDADIYRPKAGSHKPLHQVKIGATYWAIVNLAAEHKDNVQHRSLCDAVNVEGARQVCLATEETGIEAIVFTSSVAVYGRAPANCDENCGPAPINAYGRTKLEAEGIYRNWLAKDPAKRTLVIVCPKVVIGERNRGNIYNLLPMIADKRFVIVGRGDNIKSVAYVENVAAMLHLCLESRPGMRLFNYVDEPDFTMKELVHFIRAELKEDTRPYPIVSFWLAYTGARFFELLALLTNRAIAISSLRVKKF
jgi:nucleoside-diphosphate-sugar epimerase